jgi:hypothetical protein
MTACEWREWVLSATWRHSVDLSWALRALVYWDRVAVRQFVSDHNGRLAARVKREVGTKLRTGRKNEHHHGRQHISRRQASPKT